MTEIKFSPEAIADLQNTKSYIADELCNEQAAVSTIEKILKRILMLKDFPELGAPLSSIVNLDTDYRFLVCGNYTAFYRVEMIRYIFCVCFTPDGILCGSCSGHRKTKTKHFTKIVI